MVRCVYSGRRRPIVVDCDSSNHYGYPIENSTITVQNAAGLHVAGKC